MKNKQKISNKAGFSLVEVLISLLVLTAGITGAIVLMTGNIKNHNNTKNQIIAGELVQEGIELIRNYVDQGNMTSLKAAGSVVASIDYTSTAPTSLVDAGRLYFLASSLRYTIDANNSVPTMFYRKIDIDTTNASFVEVKSTVNWNSDGSFPLTCSFTNKCISSIAVFPVL
ncbi:MAG: putative pilin protein, similar to PilV [Candidatus Moranbacteria bacterium GW2011_GWE1_36_7]|nr:MAG: putative pilin protein, similar to PilV [Candidatus Moranbacteria bacterium GW2011_GWD2_36_12]KKQ06590.1 MAG: putative pilin protein, similar to PilV [Candidatus Moranbacteria bacterium GW2011_GWE2_36_40]KKQ15535.1 MAG: putative pilin protein, similar to PilV [Candidatus Moranbacteria bacterium GW2011_GWE1_36_7]